MSKHIPAIISNVVANDLCVGCGTCADRCDSNALKMEWNENGFLIPVQLNECINDKDCLKVCPFNPNDSTTIDQLFEANNSLTTNRVFHPEIGNYNSLYAGHSIRFRETSSSGGIATWIIDELFNKGLIEYAIGVANEQSKDTLFSYQVITKDIDSTQLSKTKYYPTTLEGIFTFVRTHPGAYAISGLPCFLKAVRLYQAEDTLVKERIKYLIGITCGGMKSRFFTEYLAWKVNITPEQIQQPEYRVKSEATSAGDYSFSFLKQSEPVTMKTRQIGDTWANGIFKANSCDYCDDLFGDLSDISVGDAWIDPYARDGRGTNLVIVRSNQLDKLIKDGIVEKALTLVSETEDRIVATQKGNFTHRRTGLQYRLLWIYISGLEIKGKRVKRKVFGNLVLLKVLRIRMIYRAKSFEAWKTQRSNFAENTFDLEMAQVKKDLAFYTRIRSFLKINLVRQILNKVRRIN